MKVAVRAALTHACVAALMTTALADEPVIPRIGVVAQTTYEEGLREGLARLGYVEGRNIAIDWRRSGGAADEERSLAIDLLRSKPDVIVAFGTPAARAAIEVAAVPIVFMSSDPVGSGLVQSLARPGGNATGVSSAGPDLMAKRLQLLRQFAPRARRIGCLVNTSNPVGALQLEQARKASRALHVELVKFDAHGDAELETALHAIPRSQLDALLLLGDNLFLANSSKIAHAVRKARLPAMSPVREFMGEGILVSYGPSMKEAGRMTAVYVHKILTGAKPGDLPIEEISKLDFIIDLRAARELSLKIPQDLLYRADEVIR